MLAYDYPLLGVFWTMLMLFLWIAWLFILFHVVVDIFRSDDLGGWGKAGWFLFVVVVPLLGVLVYVLARGDSMQQRDIARSRAQQEQLDAYIREAAATSGVSTADELAKLGDLKDRGVITDEEFASSKAKLLS